MIIPPDSAGFPEAPAVFAGEDLLCVRGERAIFAGLSFRLAPGGALLLLGPNGSGKSSLLRLLALLLRPAAGRLTWGGQAVAADPEAHGGRCHYVGHLDAIKPVLALRENVAFWAKLGGAGETHVDRALKAFALSPLAAIPGRMLSAGQKRRANLARLIAAPAPLWLLDEPTTALDRASIGVLEDLIARHRAAGGMVVVSTHQDITLPGATVLALDHFAPDPSRAAGLFLEDEG
ncbi:heme ABC exporter ATP-binding protein CcmA [Rhodospirillum rubrum]|uniref:heme ABC exporter ATP-binding protein CcmA n=1 Tax=Rhodospirillum rubrum TaxID=1085 RepID=UPI0019064071|nr:heme ABC exporter ATP-binding protein CcmA [Rhodospirillum rubrum]MBK1665983.1 heme ABC exporter ATP-binding protein CcmA [Rhodospirillum rubrum]MBK1677950.1 heme ABC exporter ATP-binding protein CcmA [Rhodospirillum rubrum]